MSDYTLSSSWRGGEYLLGTKETRYLVEEKDRDHNAQITAANPEDAAREYWEEYTTSRDKGLGPGNWAEFRETSYHQVVVWAIDEQATAADKKKSHWTYADTFTLPWDPPEPDCSEAEHDWEDYSPVMGSGGGVKWSEKCPHCGLVKERDTWAQAETGEQGLDSTTYVDDDYDEDDEWREDS